jgi:hypothetical protein
MGGWRGTANAVCAAGPRGQHYRALRGRARFRPCADAEYGGDRYKPRAGIKYAGDKIGNRRWPRARVCVMVPKSVRPRPRKPVSRIKNSPDRSAAEAELRRGRVTPRVGTSYFHGRRARLPQSLTFCATEATTMLRPGNEVTRRGDDPVSIERAAPLPN